MHVCDFRTFCFNFLPSKPNLLPFYFTKVVVVSGGAARGGFQGGGGGIGKTKWILGKLWVEIGQVMALHALKLTEMKKITSTGLNLIPRGCTGTHSYLVIYLLAIVLLKWRTTVRLPLDKEKAASKSRPLVPG